MSVPSKPSRPELREGCRRIYTAIWYARGERPEHDAKYEQLAEELDSVLHSLGLLLDVDLCDLHPDLDASEGACKVSGV